jgi:hypothetical protein
MLLSRRPMLKNVLPSHPDKVYAPARKCIYCGSHEGLSDEHIIPYGLGGQWILPKASCPRCASVTSAFEGTCLHPMFGPFRMYYDFPTRRRGARPKTLPLKVKRRSGDDWTFAEVEQEVYPFLILFPHYTLPDAISGLTSERRDSATKRHWIRGVSFRYGLFVHLEELARTLGVVEIMPTAKVQTHEFSLLLAKIAHAFAVAELGGNAFHAFLPAMIMDADTSNSANYVGGLPAVEPRSSNLHEVFFDSGVCTEPDIIAVRIRLIASAETPTYYVAVGRARGQDRT